MRASGTTIVLIQISPIRSLTLMHSLPSHSPPSRSLAAERERERNLLSLRALPPTTRPRDIREVDVQPARDVL